MEEKVYKLEDLISFGNYLLSEERTQLIKDSWDSEKVDIQQKLSVVHDGDIANWLSEKI